MSKAMPAGDGAYLVQLWAFGPRGPAGLLYWNSGILLHRNRFRKTFADVIALAN
jgi:hypothetical protein